MWIQVSDGNHLHVAIKLDINSLITRYRNFRNIWEVFVSIYTKENGTRALYRGYVATVLGVIPYAGTSFFTYETLKQKYFEMTGETKTNAVYSLLFGACAGICGQTSSYPLGKKSQKLEVIKGSDSRIFHSRFFT